MSYPFGAIRLRKVLSFDASGEYVVHSLLITSGAFLLQGYISGCHIVDRPSSGVSSMSSSLSSRGT